MASDTPELRKAILHNLINNQEYSQKVLPFLSDEYFGDKSEKIIFNEVKDYFVKYDQVPTYAAVRIQVQERPDLTDSLYTEIEKFLEKEVEPLNKVEYLVNKTEM